MKPINQTNKKYYPISILYYLQVYKDIYILNEIDQVYIKMNENLSNLYNLLGSKYLKNQRAKVEML